MNQLSLAERAQIISALTEGVSIRGAARLYGFSKVTVNSLARNVGNGCMKLHDALMVGLKCQRLEIDEIHSFVQNKKSQEEGKGQQYTFIALCGSSRAIVSYYTGKHTSESAQKFLTDTRQRVVGEPEISSDCFVPYLKAVRETCGGSVKYGRISKSYGIMATGDILGRQEIISTQRVERQNLTLRQTSKRFGRRSWGFSKNFESHCAAVGLYVFHYNFCRINTALKITPAMQLGLSNHAWTVEQLVAASLQGVIDFDEQSQHQITVDYSQVESLTYAESEDDTEIEEPCMAGTDRTPITDMVSQMLARGVEHDIILLAVKAAEQASQGGNSGGIPVDEAAERRRAYDRDRKRLAAEIHRNSVETPQNSETPLTSSSSQQLQVPKEEKNKGRGTTLSADWQPSASHFDEGAKLKLTSFEVEALADDMRLWAGANSNRAVARKSNWNLAFSAWMRREAGKRKPTNAKSGIIDAADRALESLRQSEREATERDAGIGGEAPFRLISQG